MNRTVVTVGIFIILVGLAAFSYSNMDVIRENISDIAVAQRIPASSIDPELKFATPIDESSDVDRYVVELTAPVGMATVQQERLLGTLATIGVQVNRQYTMVSNALTITATPDEIHRVSELGDVQRIYRDRLLHGINTDLSPSTPSSYARDLDIAGYTGKGVMVMVIDTGINGGLPIFQRDGESVVTEYFSVFNEQYTHWHGTMIGGIIAGQGIDALPPGIAPGSSLGSVCVFDHNGEAYLSDIIDGLEYVARWSISHSQFVVASCSWGIENNILPCTPANPCIVCSSTARLATRYGIPVVAAAGNSGPSPGSINHPAASMDIIAVGAVTSILDISSFSSRGPISGLGEVKPDIVAYGQAIKGVDTSGSIITASGTSFSAPMVTAVVAQIAERYGGSGYSPSHYEMALEQSAQDLGIPGPDDTYGYGFVNATGAFSALGEQTPTDTYTQSSLIVMLIGGVIAGYGTVSPGKKKGGRP